MGRHVDSAFSRKIDHPPHAFELLALVSNREAEGAAAGRGAGD